MPQQLNISFRLDQISHSVMSDSLRPHESQHTRPPYPSPTPGVIWSLAPLPFLKPVWTSGSSRLTYCWSLAWRILSITLLACEMGAIVRWFEHSLALPFFGIGMKTDLFQSCGHLWVFQICWHIECSTFTASSFRIWNSSTGILSPPLALFVVMLSKAHLTSQSRMSGSRSVITPSQRGC